MSNGKENGSDGVLDIFVNSVRTVASATEEESRRREKSSRELAEYLERNADIDVLDDSDYRNGGIAEIAADGSGPGISDDDEEEEKKLRLLEVIKKELYRARTYTPKVGVFGVTGVGKSSLCNALFGRDVAKISDVAACTRAPQEIMIGDSRNGGLILVDVPGVGENEARDVEYINLYKSLMPELDLVLWAIKADDRAYASAVRAYKTSVEPYTEGCPVVFVVTHTDKIEPFREWDEVNNRPSSRQLENIALKKHEISKEFSIPVNSVIAVSAREHYNLDALVTRVVEVLPNEKKISFAREAKEENVTQDAIEAAETGLLDHLGDMLGDALVYVRYELGDAVKSTVKKYVPKLAGAAVAAAEKWLKKLFF